MGEGWPASGLFRFHLMFGWCAASEPIGSLLRRIMLTKRLHTEGATTMGYLMRLWGSVMRCRDLWLLKEGI